MKTAEEILKSEMSEYYWEYIEAQKTANGEMVFKKWIIEAMEEYASQFNQSNLPTDEEIRDYAEKKYPTLNDMLAETFERGAKWLKSKILNKK